MKKIISLGLVLSMMVCLCGCSITYDSITIANNSIKEVVFVDIQKDYLDKLSKDKSLDTDERASIVSLIAAMDIVDHNGDSYYRYKQSGNASFKEYINTYDPGRLKDGAVYVTNDIFYERIKLQEKLENLFVFRDLMRTYDNAQKNGNTENYGHIKIDYSKIKYNESITFTKNIVNTNGKIDKDNPKTVSYSFDGPKKDEFINVFATTNKNHTVTSVEKFLKNSRKIAKPKIKKIKANKVKKKAKKASITVSIKKVKGAKEYWYECSTDKKFEWSESKESKKTKVTFKKLKKNKKYYVHVVAVKEDYSGNLVESKYSKTKKIKTKK